MQKCYASFSCFPLFNWLLALFTTAVICGLFTRSIDQFWNNYWNKYSENLIGTITQERSGAGCKVSAGMHFYMWSSIIDMTILLLFFHIKKKNQYKYYDIVCKYKYWKPLFKVITEYWVSTVIFRVTTWRARGDKRLKCHVGLQHWGMKTPAEE